MVPPAPGRRRRWQTNCQVLNMSIKSALFAFAFSGRRRVERPRRFAFVGNFLRFESFLFLWHSGNAGAFRERERICLPDILQSAATVTAEPDRAGDSRDYQTLYLQEGSEARRPPHTIWEITHSHNNLPLLRLAWIIISLFTRFSLRFRCSGGHVWNHTVSLFLFILFSPARRPAIFVSSCLVRNPIT